MIKETYQLWTKEEYTYPVMGQFIPNVVTYIHEKGDRKRPAMIVVPGGGYSVVSPTEGEIVAKEFYRKGYNAFVVTYTTNLLKASPLRQQPLKDLSKAVMFVRKRAEQFNIDSSKVVICGFSAGGHLCGSLAVHHNVKELVLDGEYEGINNRPDAVILSYPVITSGEYGHKDSFISLFGPDATEEELEYMSLEKHVTQKTPPTFIWHTATDELVPVENSYLFANACKEQGVVYEHHVFGNGRHGLSLANEDWASGNYGGDYTMQQLYETVQYLVDNGIKLPETFNMFGTLPEGASVREAIKQGLQRFAPDNQPDQGIAIWPELANNWLRKLFGI
ncbi:alpha/beta hydrolase [Neobacillus cucumis]|uniref:alpha/beta hydrolase n=1 Tax=Neobacillus cucumis TaxID=1740721 RepID=UPI00196258F2|nr:alpha/beta hydrolase [Neobacillus cucumis]MBM7655537.1 acetyl esterase/lipase [Neobacillus cucumis]